MADLTVARLLVNVGADLSDLNRGMGQAEGAVNSFVGAASSASATLGRLFTGTVVTGIAGIATGLGVATKSASDFEKTISGVMAVGGKEAASMRKEIEALALKLGADTSFSATAAAEGIEELVKAGVKMSDIMGGAAKASLDLAAAGGIEVADAASLAADAMNLFNIKGSEMAGVADLIAGVANATSADVGQFKFSMQEAGAVASSVGVSFKDTATAIAVLADQGTKGQKAGTSLANMLLRLQPQTKEQTKLFQKLGLVTKDGANAFFNKKGKIKDLADVSQILQNATKNMTEQQRIATFQTLFGNDAMAAAVALTKAGAGGFKEMYAAMQGVTAADVAEERLNNLSGSIEKLKGSLSTVAITVGLALTPMFKRLVDWGTDAVNAWMPTIKAFAEQIPGAIDTTVSTVQSLIRYLGLSISGDASFAALVDALMKVPAPMRETAAWAASVATALKDKVGAAITWLTQTGWPLVQGAMATVQTYVTSTFLPMLTAVWDWLAPKLQAALGWLTTTGFPLLQTAMGTVGTWLQTAWIPTITSVWEWLKDKVGGALTWLTETAWPKMGEAANAVQNWFKETLVPTLTSAWDWLQENGKESVGAALVWLREKAWPGMKTAAEKVWEWITGPLYKGLHTLWASLQTSVGGALSWLTTQGWPLLQTAMSSVWSWIKESLVPTLMSLWSALEISLRPALTWATTTGWPLLLGAITGVTDYVRTQTIPWFQELFRELDNRGVLQDVASFINNISDAARNLINQFFPKLVSGFQETDQTASDAAVSASSLAGSIKNITSALAEWSKVGPYDLVDNFNEAIFQIRWQIWKALEVLLNSTEWLDNFLGIPHPKVPDEPKRSAPVQRPGGGGSSGGSSGGGSGGGSGGSGGGGGVVPTPPPSSITPSPGNGSGGGGIGVLAQWGNLIGLAAHSSTTPGSVIAAIMDIESGGKQNAESPMNKDRQGRPIGRAQGLMQVMPFHFPGVILGPDGEASASDKMFMQEPGRNIFKGAALLADNFGRYGSWTKAAAAYFGAIDAQGNITGGTDATGTSGNTYVNLFVEALRKYSNGVMPPNLAMGGIVRARPGGMLANIAEAGRDEAVIPLPRDWQMNGPRSRMGGDVYVTVVVQGNALGTKQEIADAVVIGLQTAQRSGRTKVTVV